MSWSPDGFDLVINNLMLLGLVRWSKLVLKIKEHVLYVVTFVHISQVVLVYHGLDFRPKFSKCLCLLLKDLLVILVFVIKVL